MYHFLAPIMMSHELWAALSEQLPLGVIIYRLDALDDDRSLRIVAGNGMASRLLGRDVPALVGRRMSEAFPGTDQARWHAYANVVRSGASWKQDDVSYGDERLPASSFVVLALPLPDQHVALVFENLSQLKRAKDEANRLNHFLDCVIEHIPAMIFIKDAKHLRFERVNRAAEELLGLSRSDLVGKDDFAFFPPAQATFFQEADRDTLASGRMLEILEEPIQTASGQRWLHTRKIPIMGASGPDHLLGISVDVTQRKLAQQGLERAEQNFRTLVEYCPDAILVQNAGVITYVNPALLTLMGYGHPEELIGRSMASIVHPDDLARVATSGLERRSESEPVIELRCVRRDGQVIVVEAAGVECEFDREPSLVVVIRDVTRRRNAEEALRNAHEQLERRVEERTAELLRARATLQQESDIRGRTEAALLEREGQLQQALKMEAVGRLAGGIAHDFNNLLSVILSYSHMLNVDARQGDPLHDGLNEIRRAAERAADLTRQLLAFSRQQVLEPKVVDLGSVVSGLDRMLRRIIGEDLQLRVMNSPNLAKVRVDPGQIEQVIVNLVVNARDAMPDGGALTVETSNIELEEGYTQQRTDVTPGSYVMVAVSDTGAGMDRATLARVFEPFFTTKPIGKGTGLGLSMVYGIVKQSGGHVWVYSEQGRGTTFKLYFPALADSVERPISLPPRPLARGGTDTILLVEDSDAVRVLVRTILRRNGYHVLEARTPAEAIGISGEHRGPIQLLLTDVVMPQMSGPRLAEALLPRRAEMRVLYVSGYTDDTIVHHGVLDSSLAFLQKPFTPDSLLRKVREVLEGEAVKEPVPV
jgi:two-component system cell cycle sensor histidine kinase/response regulator CckA